METSQSQSLTESGCNYAKQEFNTCCEGGSQEEESKVLLAVQSPVSSKTFPWIIDWLNANLVPNGKHLEDSLVAARMSQVVILSYSVNIKCQKSTCSNYLSFFFCKHKQQNSAVTLAPWCFLKWVLKKLEPHFGPVFRGTTARKKSEYESQHFFNNHFFEEGRNRLHFLL